MTIADGGLRKVVQKHLAKENGWLWTPIESGATHQGVPDSFWSHEPTQTNGWVEHKATDGWAVTIRPHQVAWIESHCRAGVRCTIMVRARGKGSSMGRGDSIWIISSSYIRELALDGLGEISRSAILGFWTGDPRKWDWREVQGILTSGRK